MARLGEIDWDDLRCVLAAARAGTLAGAARALGVEHSTISRRLTAVEEGLGAPLFTRGPDGLALTEAGQKVIPLLEQMERAALAVTEVVSAQTTRVRLATPSGFGGLLNPHLGRFQAQHPNITLELLSSSRPVDLKKSEADLALRVGPLDDPELVARKIADVGWSLYAAPTYLARHPAPADPRQLAGHDLLGFADSLAHVPGARWLQQHGQGANVVMRYRELTDMISACLAGLGLAALPCMVTPAQPLQRLTREVLGSQRLTLVYRKEVLVSVAVRAVLEFVTEVMAEHAPGMSGHQ